MTHDLSHELATTRCRGRKGYTNPRMLLFVMIWVILIIATPSSAVHRHPKTVPSGGKAAFFRTASPKFHATARSRKAGEDDDLYDEDKRLVHTGPNPLHN
ncbi:CLAVATA3/ESR (CLE)-related protein 16-like [Bidens hawaiensis]|uniref:CLAVATA3/ESR (CLE)-related protein 16-like n=1 Tax=Bidens hawaiensis TaxID=980011 RepID=UPI004049A895